MPFNYMSVTDFATLTHRSTMGVRKMIYDGILVEVGFSVVGIPPRRKTSNRKVLRWAIGVPIEIEDQHGKR